ncbi:MAG TPA: DUF1800 family protein, partial [Terracidiphilus sp.]
MARDSQAALMALNRFGFGARGGASGDLFNAASDPRGFVKAELNRPNTVRLEVPGLQTTPVLAQAVFAFQDEQKAKREAAAKTASAAPDSAAQAADAKRQNPSLTSAASEMPGKMSAMETQDKGGANASMPSGEKSSEPMQPNAAKPPAQPLNVIQKTYRAEALARLQRAMISDCGFTERLVTFWSNHFCISANKGELAR